MTKACIFLSVFLGISLSVFAEESSPLNKERLIILADMGNEPDEEQQMAHMLMNNNEFHLEALIAVTGKYLRPEHKVPYRQKVHPELFHKLIDAYEKVLPNLKLHAKGWHEAEYLRSIVYSGQSGYGYKDVGPGKESPGSKALMKSLEKNDSRPVWIVVNAGSNTLAQALFDLDEKFKTSPAEFDRIISKIRVFENGAQDNAGAWICNRYPKIHWIRSNFQTYSFGGPQSELGPHTWKPFEYSYKGQHDWLKEHVQRGHGALGEVYPDRAFGKNKKLHFLDGGGTVPWLGLVNKGLFDINEPSWGGWSGRFSKTKQENFWSRHKDIMADEEKIGTFKVYSEDADTWRSPEDGKEYKGSYVPVWRWRTAMYNNLQCRMDWCVKSFKEANHHPVAAVNGNSEDTILRISAKASELLKFDASASSDRDGDEIDIRWWQYREAGTYPGTVKIEGGEKSLASIQIPADATGKQIHIILEVKDKSSIASLYDYRRVVIDVQ